MVFENWTRIRFWCNFGVTPVSYLFASNTSILIGVPLSNDLIALGVLPASGNGRTTSSFAIGTREGTALHAAPFFVFCFTLMDRAIIQFLGFQNSCVTWWSTGRGFRRRGFGRGVFGKGLKACHVRFIHLVNGSIFGRINTDTASMYVVLLIKVIIGPKSTGVRQILLDSRFTFEIIYTHIRPITRSPSPNERHGIFVSVDASKIITVVMPSTLVFLSWVAKRCILITVPISDCHLNKFTKFISIILTI